MGTVTVRWSQQERSRCPERRTLSERSGYDFGPSREPSDCNVPIDGYVPFKLWWLRSRMLGDSHVRFCSSGGGSDSFADCPSAQFPNWM